ncbi:Basigin [Operophtera brumata]|uniref:Basigin n=1 Tax=Operophtera brumata TaxID=104452 RepID=A0A0L7KXS0_OPEBR|nr:Basigin [Operophtera brumata]
MVCWCHGFGDMTAPLSLRRTKNNSAVVFGDPKGAVLEKEGAVLKINRAHEDDFGNYTCHVGGSVARAWQAYAKPIARMSANTNVVEGQKFSITCKQFGKPYQRVSWTYAPAEGENATLLETSAPDSRFTVRDSPAGVPGGVLELAAALRSDAGVYACVPEHGTFAVSTLRVKDVYAALWPFLGICLEVFILCAIILVYEKRRTKPELDDSDADQHDQ